MPQDVQITRLADAGVQMTAAEQDKYLLCADELPKDTASIPKGYKRCTKCGAIKKIYLFNRNAQAKDNCTSQCKACQAANAHKSYAKNKHKRNYKKYYQENKEKKQEQSRQYYAQHKEELKIKHAKYRATAKGKKAMTKAHAKRAKLLKANAGIPYTREMILERDRLGGTEPICYLCGKPITGTPHLDHVIPVVMGGKNCFTNVACVHDTCNLRKSKDAREITTEQVNTIITRSEEYMEAHQDLFPDIFGTTEDSVEAPDAFGQES